MDAKYFEEIKAREQTATPGPWNLEIKGNTVQSLSIIGICHGMKPNNADAAFISHARTDIPALIAEVERLKKSNELFSEENHTLYQQIATLKKALRMACEDQTELCPYGLHGENRRCAEDHRPMLCKSCAPEYYIQQAQEQEGQK